MYTPCTFPHLRLKLFSLLAKECGGPVFCGVFYPQTSTKSLKYLIQMSRIRAASECCRTQDQALDWNEQWKGCQHSFEHLRIYVGFWHTFLIVSRPGLWLGPSKMNVLCCKPSHFISDCEADLCCLWLFYFLGLPSFFFQHPNKSD